MPLGVVDLVVPARVPLTQALGRRKQLANEQRSGRRSLFEHRLLLTPLKGVEPLAEPTFVTGRDLSSRGLGFEHHQPITHRKVRLVAADEALDDLGFADLEIDLVLKWCRFIAPGVYLSGGRVTRTTVPLF